MRHLSWRRWHDSPSSPFSDQLLMDQLGASAAVISHR